MWHYRTGIAARGRGGKAPSDDCDARYLVTFFSAGRSEDYHMLPVNRLSLTLSIHQD
jgi:hypothetical protein